MERNELLSQLSEVFNEVLDTDGLLLTNTTVADDVEGWDSLTHVHLVVVIERKFKCRFTSKEIQSWKNVGEMCDCIEGKLS